MNLNSNENLDQLFAVIYEEAKRALEEKRKQKVDAFVGQIKGEIGLSDNQRDKLKEFLNSRRGRKFLD